MPRPLLLAALCCLLLVSVRRKPGGCGFSCRAAPCRATPWATSGPAVVTVGALRGSCGPLATWRGVLRPGSSLAQGRQRLRAPAKHEGKTEEALKAGIASYYDGLTPLWMDVWGEHLHHGFYGPRPSGAEPSFTGNGVLSEHRAAQVAMMDEVIAWARQGSESSPRAILDVGCGVGGATRHLVRAFPGANATGITLSPLQAREAASLSADAGLGEHTGFKVQDALAMPQGWSEGFDFVWSLESGEHMPNKPKFVEELARVAAPGGRVVVVTWCHRDLKSGEKDLKGWESALLRVINSCYYLPRWVSVADYERLCAASGLEEVRRADWTDAIAPFWPAVIRSAVRPRNFMRLVRTGLDGVRSAIAMVLMVFGYRVGLIKFGLVTARKPAQVSKVAAAASFVGQQSGGGGGGPGASSAGAANAGEVATGELRAASESSRRRGFGAALYKFSRPHTVRGTIIASLAAVIRALQTAGDAGVGMGPLLLKVGGMVSALLCANTVCVGVNQIYDVDVDRVNKPFLPIAAGEMGVARAWLVVGAALVAGTSIVTWLFSPPLAFLYTAGMLLGSAYSVPPFRFRRWPLAAAFIIACVRGCMLNFWVYHAVKEVMLRPFAWDPVVLFLTRFMTVFAAMIAVTKDLADVKGDVMGNIKTFAASFGMNRVATGATIVLGLNYAAAVLEGLLRGPGVFAPGAMLGGHLAALAYLVWSWRQLQRGRGEGADAFYRRIWHLFYFEYVVYLFL